MAHSHSHDSADYYLEQLLAIGVSGSFAAVGVMMYTGGKLEYILAPELRPWVLWGGAALGVLAVVRAVAVWNAAKKTKAHVHGPDCGHDHPAEPGHVHTADCGHDHAHDDHAHGGIFWRLVVLMFPIALFMMGLPNEGFSEERKAKMLGTDSSLGESGLANVADKDGDALTMSFADLAEASNDPTLRDSLTGRTAKLKGQLRRLGDRECTLFYFKMNCCAADMIPLKARIFSDASLANFPDGQWVTVAGKLQFAEVPGKKDQYLPVLRVKTQDVQKTKPE